METIFASLEGQSKEDATIIKDGWTRTPRLRCCSIRASLARRRWTVSLSPIVTF